MTDKDNEKDTLIFVIQKHHAKNLHYDLRLEMDGVLKSWAIPKEPPTVEGVKRLAIQVDDHALEYADFEGTIPEGSYGAGEVEIWDHGSFELEVVKEKEIIFSLSGEKMKGKFVLVKTNFGKAKNSWLFFKKKE